MSALGRTRSARQYLMMALEGLLRDEACALAKVAPPSRATQETADNLYLAWRSYAAQVDGQKPDGLEPISDADLQAIIAPIQELCATAEPVPGRRAANVIQGQFQPHMRRVGDSLPDTSRLFGPDALIPIIDLGRPSDSEAADHGDPAA